MPPRVRLPSTPSMLLSFKVKFVLVLWKITKINQKEAGFGPFFWKKRITPLPYTGKVKKIMPCFFYKKWAIPDLFFFIFVCSTQLTVNKYSIKICWRLDSNHGPLTLEATALPLSHNHFPVNLPLTKWNELASLAHSVSFRINLLCQWTSAHYKFCQFIDGTA